MAVSTDDHDALRQQIERGLGDDRRRRRMRRALVAAGVVLGLSLLVNLLVLAAPGSLGLATSADVDRARDAMRTEVAATRRAQGSDAVALTRAAGASAARAERAQAGVSAALPGICATLTALGDWSFVDGRAPATGCVPAR